MSDEAIGKRLLRRTAERPLIRVILSCATYRWPSAERALSAFFFLPTDYCFNSKGLGNARYADEKGKKNVCFHLRTVVSDSSRALRAWKGLVEIKLPFVRRGFEKEKIKGRRNYRLCQIAGLLLARLVGMYVYFKQISAAWVLGRRAYIFVRPRVEGTQEAFGHRLVWA